MKFALFFMAAIFAVSGTSRNALAFLGADESSLPAVKSLLSARSEKITTYNTHTVHEYAVGRGVIKAYVSPSGKIFAYRGDFQVGHPNPALLGSYLKEYQQGVVKSRKASGRRPLSIKTANIQAGMSGPQRALHWYFFLRSLPSGVSADDIR